MGQSQTGLQRETMKIEQGSEWIQMIPLTAAVFYRNGGKGFVIIAVTVDDLTITAPQDAILQEIKEDLMKIFKIKDLGELHWLLNLEIKRDRRTTPISFSQESFIDKILDQFNLQDTKMPITRLYSNMKLSKDQCPESHEDNITMSKIPYREAIGSLRWAAVATFVMCI